MGRSVGHFEIIPRGGRARPHLATIRRSSKCFRQSLSADDAAGMQQASVRAWDALAATFEILRGEQDDGYLADSDMQVPTGFLFEGVSTAEQTAMIVARKIDMSDSRCGQLTLREALNKIAHYRSADATFRVDRRGAHYLVLGGNRNGRHWIAEILVSRLCHNALVAAAAIQSYP